TPRARSRPICTKASRTPGGEASRCRLSGTTPARNPSTCRVRSSASPQVTRVRARAFVARPVSGLAAGAIVVVLTGCGAPPPTNGPIVLSGALHGVYKPGPPSSCGPGPTAVLGKFGPDPSRDVGELIVSDEGAISFQARN